MRKGIVLPLLGALLLVVSMPSASPGQGRGPKYRDPVLQGNPRRDLGGSCVYDQSGKVVFAPEGKYCPDGSDHLSNPSDADSPVVAGYPPELREELRRLLSDHDHLAVEVGRLREAIESGNRRVGLEAADKIRSELTAHRAREERFFEKMAPRSTEP